MRRVAQTMIKAAKTAATAIATKTRVYLAYDNLIGSAGAKAESWGGTRVIDSRQKLIGNQLRDHLP